jgi:uncharacterized repeat protein (TIGR03943 family)
MSAKLGQSLVMLGFCIFAIKLYLQGDMTLYIHPRYTLFCFVMSIIGACFFTASGYLAIQHSRRFPQTSRPRISLISYTVIGLLCLAFIVPPRALLSSAADRKSSGAQSAQTGNFNSVDGCLTLAPDYQASISDWVAIIETCNDPQKYTNTKVELTGFVYRPKDTVMIADTFMIARFLMSCCAVDASPKYLPVFAPGWEKKYKTDQWVTISGRLKLINTGGSRQLILYPDTIEKISEPKDPYDYYKQIPQY